MEEKYENLICRSCKIPWQGEIVRDDSPKQKLKPYCLLCDLYIPYDFIISLSDANTNKIIDLFSKEFEKIIPKISRYRSQLPQDHPLHPKNNPRAKKF